jgi:hypothetical protein
MLSMDGENLAEAVHMENASVDTGTDNRFAEA